VSAKGSSESSTKGLPSAVNSAEPPAPVVEHVPLLAVIVHDKWGFMNLDGKMLIEPKFIAVFPFSEGLAAVKDNQGMWGYINKDGTYAVKPQFTAATPFSEGMAVVKQDGKFGAIDHTGKFFIKPTFAAMSEFFGGYAAVLATQDTMGGMASGWGFVDKHGAWVIEPKYPQVTVFGDGLVGVRRLGQLFGYIDVKGNQVIPPKYMEAGPFAEGLAPVNIADEHGVAHWGYIDTTGKVVIPGQFQRATAFANGLAMVHDDKGKAGFINKEGKYVVPPELDGASHFVDGYALVRMKGVDTYIDKTGKVVTSVNKSTAPDQAKPKAKG
jgi:hypothetical protein